MKVMWILRGLPGVGKSTLATSLVIAAQANNNTSAICCADDYMMEGDKYVWAPEKVADAHTRCRNKAAIAVENKVEYIIIANTNTTMKEMKFYMDLTKTHNYFLQMVTIGQFSDDAVELYAKQNTHNVPIETIRKMRDRFQHNI